MRIAESRFRLGPVYVSPRIAIKEATYDSNVFGTTENPTADFRTTVQAGAGFIYPVGKNVFLQANVFPEYTWYAQLTERRFFGGKLRRISSSVRQPADAGCLRRLLENRCPLLVGGADARD